METSTGIGNIVNQHIPPQRHVQAPKPGSAASMASMLLTCSSIGCNANKRACNTYPKCQVSSGSRTCTVRHCKTCTVRSSKTPFSSPKADTVKFHFRPSFPKCPGLALRCKSAAPNLSVPEPVTQQTSCCQFGPSPTWCFSKARASKLTCNAS